MCPHNPMLMASQEIRDVLAVEVFDENDLTSDEAAKIVSAVTQKPLSGNVKKRMLVPKVHPD